MYENVAHFIAIAADGECLNMYLICLYFETSLRYNTLQKASLNSFRIVSSPDHNPQKQRLDIYLIITYTVTECAKENTNKR